MGTTQKYEHDLIEFVDGSQFAWSDPFLLGMVDHHVFRVEAISDDSARFHHSDQVKDGAARFIGALMARTMKRMYVGFNQELATEVARRRSETG